MTIEDIQCHRRYDDPSETIGLAIYDDRVEISNPGHFPPGVTPENIKTLHASRPHNPKLAQVLYKATRIENWGSGIQRMVSACVNQELPEPVYDIWADGTIVIVFHKKSSIQGKQTGKQTGEQTGKQTGEQTGKQTGKQAGELKTWQKIVELMRNTPSISRREIAKTLGKSESAIYKHISNLSQKGIIHHVGPDFGGHWEVVEEKPKEQQP